MKRVIPGEFGSDTGKKEIIDAVPIFNDKLTITKYLQSKEDTGLSWTGIINGGFFDWWVHIKKLNKMLLLFSETLT